MGYEIMIAMRFIFSKKKKAFISFISTISILGIAVGVAALITVLAVMSGFDYELKKRVVGSNPHIVIERPNGIEDYTQLVNELDKIEHIKGAYPYIWGEGVLRSRNRAKGVVARSVDLLNRTDRSKTAAYLKEGKIEIGKDEIIVGNELASALGVFTGDEIGIITAAAGQPARFKVAGIFNSGMYEYDLNLVYIRIEAASRLFNMPARISGIGVDVDEVDNSLAVKKAIEDLIPDSYYVRTWQDMNKNLFSALKLEKFAMFVILTLIIIVAALNIVSTLTVMVTEKKKDIGILKAIGATKSAIMGIFSIQAFLIGFLGVLIGASAGITLSLLLKKYHFITLPKDIYYISQIPVIIKASDSAIISAAALFISLLASLYPAYQASRVEPADALRYE